jgi:hypothetical protein
MLKRYVTLAPIVENDKLVIIENEHTLIDHKNFSPETIRAFFANIDVTNNGLQLNELKSHLDKPDNYLSSVFYKLPEVKRAVLLSVLCATKSSEKSVLKAFSSISDDLHFNFILHSKTEFHELDDSILRILKSDKIEEIKFYHPSMFEFLTRQLIDKGSSKMREVVLKNLNNELLNLSILKTENKSFLGPLNNEIVELDKTDFEDIKIGLKRLLENEEISLYQISDIFHWFKSDSHIIDLKFTDRKFFLAAKGLLTDLTSIVECNDFYYSFAKESNAEWANLLLKINNAANFYGIEINSSSFSFISKILKEKVEDTDYWMLVLRILSFTNDNFIKEQVGRDWLNSFYLDLRNNVIRLGEEVFGADFPEFKVFMANRKEGRPTDKIIDKPNKTWYPRFLDIKSKVDMLKEVKGTQVGNIILEKISPGYAELVKISDFARNRHGFIIDKGWWNKEN